MRKAVGRERCGLFNPLRSPEVTTSPSELRDDDVVDSAPLPPHHLPEEKCLTECWGNYL